ncbi:MAG: hypothetical protein RJA70_1576 [Pseudomonadota bacterium]
MNKTPRFLSFCMSLLVACGGNSGEGKERTPVSGSGGAGGDNGTGPCPAEPPAVGIACESSALPNSLTPTQADCTWGQDPRPNCRTQALCQDGKWRITEGNTDTCGAPSLGADCGTAPRAAMSECPVLNAECWYPSGERCWCSSCRGGSEFPICQEITPPEWACAPKLEGCPAVMPQAGSECSDPGLSCGPNCELQIVCEGGRWRWQQGLCPICASPETPIATPEGERRLADIRTGDHVYSVHNGATVPVRVLNASHTTVFEHFVLRVVLDNGRVLEVSPGHPTGDNLNTFADLYAGGPFDDMHRVVSLERVKFTHGATYDILPDSDTGSYFAAGAQVGSSLFSRR